MATSNGSAGARVRPELARRALGSLQPQERRIQGCVSIRVSGAQGFPSRCARMQAIAPSASLRNGCWMVVSGGTLNAASLTLS